MLKKKTIGLGVLGLLVIGCEPLPPYPPHHRGSHGQPHRNPYGDQGRQQPPPRGDDRRDFRDDDGRYGPPGGQNQPAPRPLPRDQYPMAERTANPNQVISPFAPYNVIDVEGFKSGQLARDPSNQQIFRVP